MGNTVWRNLKTMTTSPQIGETYMDKDCNKKTPIIPKFNTFLKKNEYNISPKLRGKNRCVAKEDPP